MKLRESGMPEECYWETLFNVELILNRLEINERHRDVVELGCGYGTFTRFLGHYIRERSVLSLEEGVRRISSLSAQQAGIADRGLIAPGQYADLVLFDPARVSDRATYEDPHLPSVGISRVWVNGVLVLDSGRATSQRPGAVIRRPPSCSPVQAHVL